MTYQIVAAGDAAPYLTRASWSKQKQLAISSGITNTGNGVSFSPDGSLCAVAHASSPYLTVYNTSNWSKVAISSGLPNTGNGVSFSPDGSLLAVAHQSSPFITVYDTSTWAAVSWFLLAVSDAKAVSFGASPAYRIRGTVRDKDGKLVSRTVRAHRRSDGVLVAQTVSAAMTGEYELLVYPDSPAEAYDVQFLAAPGELLNDLIYARTTAEPVS